MSRDLRHYQEQQAKRMREAAESRKRGDCQRCGHEAGTRENRDEQTCDWRGRHITDEI